MNRKPDPNAASILRKGMSSKSPGVTKKILVEIGHGRHYLEKSPTVQFPEDSVPKSGMASRAAKPLRRQPQSS
jgi:hypothetical protein